MVLSKEEIKKIIPHRDPFLFVDGVSAMDATQTVEAFYDVRENDMYFEGHFPEHKVMPGVIILEAMAQAGAVCLLSNPDFTGKLIVFAGADKVKFKRPVYPGDRLILKLTTLSLRSFFGTAQAYAYVNEKLVAEAIISFGIGSKP